jgi:hypothetical protein
LPVAVLPVEVAPDGALVVVTGGGPPVVVPVLLELLLLPQAANPSAAAIDTAVSDNALGVCMLGTTITVSGWDWIGGVAE